MLTIRKLEKEYRSLGVATRVLSGIDIEVAEGEFFVLLGPSGCGKTTTLRSIAGLERPDRGSIHIANEEVFNGGTSVFVPPERRPISMVFQSYAIWPHMSVRENIAFPLREGVRGVAPAELKSRVASVLTLLHLEPMADRAVTTLSGGQQQRVALARALALQPKVLLMDEPLSNLDSQLQVELRGQIKQLTKRLGLTVVYVTHNQVEAMDLADRIAILHEGMLIQVGTPAQIYQTPETEFVAKFIGEMSFLRSSVIRVGDPYLELATQAGRVQALPMPGSSLAAQDPCRLAVRPEDICLAEAGSAGQPNHLTGKVTSRQYVGEGFVYSVSVGGDLVKFRTHHERNLDEGQQVCLQLKPHRCLVLKEAGS